MRALANFLLTQEPDRSGLVSRYDPLKPLPLSTFDPVKRDKIAKSKTLGWVAVGSAAGAVVLGGVAFWQSSASGSSFDEARGMLAPDGTLRTGSVSDYNSALSDGKSSKNMAMVAGIGAGTAALSSAVLGYLSYRQTGEIGPFRF
jgi:ABC-type Na+ efflux pump permease subunit